MASRSERTSPTEPPPTRLRRPPVRLEDYIVNFPRRDLPQSSHSLSSSNIPVTRTTDILTSRSMTNLGAFRSEELTGFTPIGRADSEENTIGMQSRRSVSPQDQPGSPGSDRSVSSQKSNNAMLELFRLQTEAAQRTAELALERERLAAEERIRLQAIQIKQASEDARERESKATEVAMERERLQMQAAQERERAQAERERAQAEAAQERERAQAERLISVMQINSQRSSRRSSRRASYAPSRTRSPDRMDEERHGRASACKMENGPSLCAQELHEQLEQLREGELERSRVSTSRPYVNSAQGRLNIQHGRTAPASSPVGNPAPVRPQPTYHLIAPQVEGPTFPYFNKETRANYVELRVCLRTLLNDDQPEMYKYAILLKHVKVPKAYNMVIAHAESSTPYTSALESLDDHYCRPWDYALQEINDIHQLPAVKDDKGLDDFTVRIQTLVGMLKTLGEAGLAELYCTSSVERLLSKIPKYRQERFRGKQRRLHPEKPGLSMIDLADFLREEVRNLRIDLTEAGSSKCEREKGDRTFKNRGRTAKVMLSADASKKEPKPTATEKSASRPQHKEKRAPPPCPYCAQVHWLDQCDAFVKMNTEERVQWIRENKRCWRCARDHFVKQCTLKRPCKECDQPHLTLLHEVNQKDRKEPAEPKMASAQVYYLDPAKDSQDRVLLKVVKVRLHHGEQEFETYAVLDDGSERTILLPEAARQLGLQGPEERLTIRTIRRDLKEIVGARVTFDISQAGRSETKYTVSDVFTGDQLTLSRYDYPLDELQERYPHLGHLEIDPISGAKPTLLIGSDNVRLVIPVIPPLMGPPGCPVAIKTLLGWTLQGAVDKRNRSVRYTRCLHVGADFKSATLLDHVQRLWMLDTTPFKNEKTHIRSKEDKYALDLLDTKTLRVNIDGVERYATPLLRRDPMPDFQVRPEVVTPLLNNTERKLAKDPELALSYRAEMAKLVDTGLVTKLESAEVESSPESWYLPHHNVRHNGKNRVVFNCSFKVGQLNLNRHLLPGPTLTPSLLGVLVRFRQRRTAVSGDIKRMFHQVRLLAEDKPLMRFLWREKPGDPEPTVYQWDVLPFGTTCSPCCATYALQRHASQDGVPTDVSKSVHENFYVDNCLQSVNTTEEATRLVRDLRATLATGGFEVCQWASNDPRVIEDLPNDAKSVSSETWVSESSDGAQEMTLGLLWRFQTDTLCYKHKEIAPRTITMRSIYSVLASQYDPLGYIIPFTTRAKILVRELWTQERGWDDPLPAHLGKGWKEWEEELPTLEHVQLPRSYFPPAVDMGKSQFELHVFCDASQEAYGSVAYLSAREPGGSVHVSFVLARSRVAPKKQQSIPRLELCAALNGAQLARTLQDEISLDLHRTVMWSDSTTVITWVQSSSCRYKVFVGTRVTEIQDLVPVDSWRYVNTKMNPADIITRGATLRDLSEPNLYHQGPEFLRQTEKEWPTAPSTEELREEVEVEVKKTLFCGLLTMEQQEELAIPDCPTLEDMQRKVFCEENGLPPTTHLSAEDYRTAEQLVLKKAQREAFSEELDCLRKGKPVPYDSRLQDLAPELTDDIIRVGGRLRRATDVPEDTKHPIVLPAKHQVTWLVIQHYDSKLGHPGAERVFGEIRRRFWILHGREAVRRFQKKCADCVRWRAAPKIPHMADLPPCRLRLNESPFHNTGMDCFGPFQVRRGRVSEKRWGLVYKCLTTKAVHIEVLHYMTADSFLMSFRRFQSRRGTPRVIWSDQGTNFKGGEKELRESYLTMGDEIRDRLARCQVDFKFNPPNAPHFGGVWEREVRSIKTAMYAVLGRQTLTDEVFTTVLVEIEGILNSKPLGYASSDVADVDPVTPNSLLMGRRDPTLPQAVYDPSELSGRRLWRHSQVLADQFWRQFTLHYLPSLQVRQKWNKERENLTVGTVVMVVDQSLPRAMWPTGRVKEVIAGVDGRVRTARVDVNGRTYTRPVARLIELPSFPEPDET